MKKVIAHEAKELALAFAFAGEAIEGALAEGLMVGALIVERAAKRACPVDTGRLRASITSRTRRELGQVVAEVGTNVEYASYVETGTSRARPQPFLAPALEGNRAAIEQAVRAAIRRAVSRA